MALCREKLTKYTAYYRCPDDIRNFKIRIKYKEVEVDIAEGDNEDIDINWQTSTISWQEKVLSKNERDFYADALNCITDLEKRYHEQLTEQESGQNGPLFTYIEEDGYLFDQEVFHKTNYLKNIVESTNLSEEEYQNDDVYDFKKHLQSSVQNKVISSRTEKMYVMVDLGEFVENLWLKNEQILCSVKYNRTSKVLSIYPDFTTTKPYYIKLQSDSVKYFFYLIENCSEISEELVFKEKEVIKKVCEYKQSIRRRIVGDKFPLPPKNKLHVYLFIEILSAKCFEYSNVYIQYYIDLPEGWSCEHPETLRGKTQTCHGVTDENLLHFGHCLDVVLQYDLQRLNKKGILKSPYIYFEIISKDSWDRYRTEGLTYKNLPISEPGCHFYNLSCFRFDEGPWGNLKRFFIGDCSNYKDVTWIGVPGDNESTVINKFVVDTVGTGELNVRLNVMHQSQAFLKEFNEGDMREKFIYEKLNSSSLIKSVEEVLQAFRKARRNMLEVRKNL